MVAWGKASNIIWWAQHFLIKCTVDYFVTSCQVSTFLGKKPDEFLLLFIIPEKAGPVSRNSSRCTYTSSCSTSSFVPCWRFETVRPIDIPYYANAVGFLQLPHNIWYKDVIGIIIKCCWGSWLQKVDNCWTIKYFSINIRGPFTVVSFFSRQSRRLDLSPWFIRPPFERDGGLGWFSWRKNSSTSPSLLWLAMYKRKKVHGRS